MGMMAKMRSLAPWFIISVGGIFVLFMVLSDSKVTEILGQRTNNVGYINGEPITYQEFSKIVDNARQNQSKQTGQDLTEDQMEIFRDQVWDALVSQKLVEEKTKEYGIMVTDDEIKDQLLGPNPPQIITQYFLDSLGNFDRQRYEEAIFDPQNKQAMLQTEDIVRQQKVQEKLESIINSSIVVSEKEVQNKFKGDNIKMYADYAFFNLNLIPDSIAAITDEDIQKYYDAHLEDQKVPEQRKIKYVLFKKEASANDSVALRENLEAIVEKVKNDTSSFKTYVDIYSEQPFRTDTMGVAQIPSGASELITKAKVGELIGPVITFEGYVVYKLVGKFKGKEEFVNASHILIKSDKDDAAAKKTADEIYKQLMNGADFAQLAREKSEDPGSAVKGGSLGWFGKGQMVKPFEQACYSGRVGRIQRPVKSRFGYHIIRVDAKSNTNYALEKIVNKIQPSATTVDRLYNNACDFSYLADKNDFESEANLMNYQILESTPFAEDVKAIPGVGANKGLMKFVFDASIGDVSDAFKVTAGYVVATLSDVQKAGFKPFETVKSSLEFQVKREKKKEVALEFAKKARTLIGDSGELHKAVEAFDKVVVSTASNFTLNKSIPGVGNEPKFANFAFTAEVGSVSDAFAGNRGAYIVKLTQRSDFDSTSFNIQHDNLYNTLLQSKKASAYKNWLEAIKANAEIEDNRYMFYK